MTILKTSQLKSNLGKVLDRAIRAPQYVERNGTLLVITKANLIPVRDEAPFSPWHARAKNLESFYGPAKAW